VTETTDAITDVIPRPASPEQAPEQAEAAANGRVRHRQGKARVRGGIPYSDPTSTLSLLPGAAIGEWLADVGDVFTGRLLDAGAGNQPYREWYEPRVDQVVAVDAAPIEGLSALAFANRLPFRDASFDTVLSTQVWEHVEDAGAAARETFRVLRPGGHLVVTVPFFYPTHEAPYDFARFTRYGLTAVLRNAGFEVERIDAQGGPLLLGSHMGVLAFSQALNAFGRLLRLRRPLSLVPGIRHLLCLPQQLAIAVRYRLRGTRRGIRFGSGLVSLGYFAVARKPVD
jgi:SAM-dependent methyltransferase